MNVGKVYCTLSIRIYLSIIALISVWLAQSLETWQIVLLHGLDVMVHNLSISFTKNKNMALCLYPPPAPPPTPPPRTILKRPKSIFMKIEIFAFFEFVNQKLSFHVHSVKFLSQEPLKKLSGTLSLNDNYL